MKLDDLTHEQWTAFLDVAYAIIEAARPFAEYAVRIDGNEGSRPYGDPCPMRLDPEMEPGTSPTLGECRRLRDLFLSIQQISAGNVGAPPEAAPSADYSEIKPDD